MKFVLTVQGRESRWSFEFDGEPEYWVEWLEDGLMVEELVNTIPEWVVKLRLEKVWCFLQDVGLIPL